MKFKVLETELRRYEEYLEREEKSPATQKQYIRDILAFLSWGREREMDKETVVCYKAVLQDRYQVTSVNAKLAALGGFFSFMGRPDLKVRQMKIQRRAYCSREKELSRDEYLRLVKAAKEQKNEKLALLLQTICATGIRVSELRFITAEAVRKGEAAIQLKGKNRIILLPQKLCRLLKAYLKRKGIINGPVFITRTGKPLDRSNIWKRMKALCTSTGVEPQKVYPHNLRHLFARSFYSIDKDIARLADILGHSSIDTTRIYIVSSGQEHLRRMEALRLVV